MAPSKRFSNTYSYSYITKLATSVTDLCPKVVYKLLMLASALATKEAHSFLAHYRLALASIRTLFG